MTDKLFHVELHNIKKKETETSCPLTGCLGTCPKKCFFNNKKIGCVIIDEKL